MIGNWIKNTVIAVVLNAGVAYAFDDKDARPNAELAVPAQACVVPQPAHADVLISHDSQTDQHGTQS